MKFVELCFPNEGQVFVCCWCDALVDSVMVTERDDDLRIVHWTVLPCGCQNRHVDRVV